MSAHKAKFPRWYAWVVCAWLVAGACAYAQQDSGGILIAVTDASGATVGSAAVDVTNNGTQAHLHGTTNSIGTWTATPLPPGDYRVTVAQPGFETAVVDHVVVEIQQNTRVPVSLAVGNVKENLVVTAQAPLLQTENVALGQTLSGVLKDDLPVSDRDFNRLAVLTVGVNYSTPSGPRDTASGAFAANGVSQYQNNYVLDGTDNNSYDQNVNEGRTFAIEPSLDAIAEFRVETNAYSAEFGRDGGAVVNVITKSGSNNFHGSGYEYFQTSDFNTNDFFNKAQSIGKTDYTKNIFGASAGGPVWLPKMYDGHDKTFFFADFERQPYRSPGAQNKGLIPTANEASGDFVSGATIYDPMTNQPFANNTIPSGRISAVAKKIAAAIPQPNISGNGSFNYVHNDPISNDDNRVAVRIDHHLSPNDTIFGRYQYQHQSEPALGLFSGTILTGDVSNTASAQGVVAGWTHIFGQHMINDARFGWTRLNWITAPVDGNQNINQSVGISGVPLQGGLAGGLATIQFTNSNLSGFGGGYSEQDLNGTYQGADTLTWTTGRHTIKLGGMYRWVFLLSSASSFAPNGQFNFDGHYTAHYTDGVADPGTGNPYADFLLDLPQVAQISAIHTNDYQRRAYSLFGEDSYKLSPKLTVNFGLRWDYVTPVWEAHNHGTALNPVTHVLNIPGYTGSFPTATQAQINKGILILNTHSNRYFGVQPDHHDFGPRFGFSYLMTSNTVFRAGYGLYFGPEQLGPFGQPSAGFSTPFLLEDTFTVPDSNPATVNTVTMDSGFPSYALTNPGDPTLYAMAPGFRTPYFQQWNATLQRQVTKDSSLDVSYMGSKTTAMYVTNDWNIPAPSVDGAVPYADRQPFPSVDANGNLIAGSPIQGPSNQGMGNYNALGIKFQGHFRNGLTLISAYTWSHDIDDITNSGLSVGNNGRASYPYQQLTLQHGNSDWDIADRWVTAFQYDLPFGRGRAFGSNLNRVADAFLGGWQTGGILTVESGPWYTVNQNYDSAHNGFICGTCEQRPDAVPGQDANRGPRKVDPNNNTVHWFNIQAFTQAANGTVGDLRRNTVAGPAFRNYDASLGKLFTLREGMTFQMRMEAYNSTNTTNFLTTSGSTSPSGFYLGNANFGNLTADRGGRTVQLAGRFVF
ncbi:TonB-dependent receptor [Paracidobacterium acidisoli]|uniref:TonB-dependent receptor n=1 Tax=Paracidobacterium acidisoli TaxID=2303751 RepID=UPI0013148F33|nr:carboxypeptidase-like regulatory domain-containing protein [Paracidobacterium acidisoli]